jgi:tetratricopeptide (TPR) repeat protein
MIRYSRTQALVVLVALSALVPSFSGASSPAHTVAVLSSSTSANLRPIAVGFGDWVEQRLAESGVAVTPGADLRAALKKQTSEGTPSMRALLAAAKSLKASRAVLIDLSFAAGQIDVLLRVHEVEKGRLVIAGRHRGPAAGMSDAAAQAFSKILAELGGTAPAESQAGGFVIDQLTSRSRAIERMESGRFANGWTELAEDESPDADVLRGRIQRTAEETEISREERLRLMAARGDSEEAWKEILREASEQLYSEKPNADVLLTAGEIQLARGKLRESQAYFERCLDLRPKDPDASLGLATALASQQDEAGARVALQSALAISPDSPRAARMLAQTPSEDRSMRARAHLAAGVETARLMRPHEAQEHYQQAVALDPNIEPEAMDLSAQLASEMGEGRRAKAAWSRAMETGGETAERKRGLARSLENLQEAEAAEIAYKESLELEHNHPATMVQLGELYSDQGRDGEAQVLLEQAVQLSPNDAEARRALARSLRRQGDLDAAIPLLREADEIAGPSAEGLQELATVQRLQGKHEEAEQTLKKAVRFNPTSPELRKELATVYREQGRDDDAKRQLELVEKLGGAQALRTTRRISPSGEAAPAEGGGQHFDGLVMSFGLAPPGYNRTVLLGVEHHMTQRGMIADWLMPRRWSMPALAEDLSAAIDPHYARLQPPPMTPDLTSARDLLFDFASNSSLDADAIAALNSSFGADSLFVALVRTGNPLEPGPCGDPSTIHVELRRLDGQLPPDVAILRNETCIPSDLDTQGEWNVKAGILWGVLTLLVGYRLIRGYGSVIVHVDVPKDTKALFAVSVTKRPRQVKAPKKGRENAHRGEVERRLNKVSRIEKRLRQGRDLMFKWRPVRSKEYYVTLRGPLFHSLSDELIGDFLEERTVKVTRGAPVQVNFDLRPKDCAVQIMVNMAGDPAPSAQVARRDDPSSLRYVSKGSAFLYLPMGEHVVLVGAGDRVSERQIRVETYDAMALTIELQHDSDLVFTDCPEAVSPFLEGNYESAANALEAVGQDNEALRMRARVHEQRGDVVAASRALEEAGQIGEAAEMLAGANDTIASASLYEEAGEFGQAAELHRESGDLLAAARAYEAAYDFGNAIDCYRQLGDFEKVIGLLEKNGDLFEAGELALEMGETGRAVQSLQQVEARHPRYGEACRLLGMLLSEQGHSDFAIEKLDEAVRTSGIESFPIDVQEHYGSLLEEAGRIPDAITVLSSVRRQDMSYREVDTRIENLKRQLTNLDGDATLVTSEPGATAVTTQAGPADADRYEILDQVGSGGMGVVYKARDKHLGRVVALKRLPENLREHPAAVKFFEREARSAAALNHPNIVTVFDAGQADGQYFITMELLEGTPLDVILKKRGALPALVVAQLGVQIATGLHFAHRNKIIHRDIKTANLFLTRDKIVKIMDFGLAKMVEEVRKGATVIGGTPYYMAPEQAGGEDVDHRADLYALGVTLYQLATANLPFTEGDISYHHRHTPPPDPREFVPELPGPLAELILQLLEKVPADRTQRAADVVKVLQSMIDQAAQHRTQAQS